MRRRIIRNFAGILTSEAIGKTAIFFTNIMLARRLGVAEFGLFTLAQTVAYFLWIGADMGTYMYGIREVARNRDDMGSIAGTLVSLKLFSGVVFYTVYVLFIWLFPTRLSILEKLAFVASGAYILSYPLYLDWIFKGMEKFGYLIAATLAYSTFFLVTVFFFVRSNADLALACILWALSYLIGGFPLFLVLRFGLKKRLSLTANTKLWTAHLKKSIYFGLAGLLSMLHGSAAIFLAGTALGQYDVGILSAAYKLVFVFSAPAYYISIAFFPIISDLYMNNRSKFRQLDTVLFLASGVAGISVALFCFVFAREIIGITYGTQYGESIRVLRVMVWVLPLQFVRYKFSNFLASTENQKLQLIPNLAVILFYVAFVLVTKLTLMSLATAIVGGESVLVIAYFAVSRYSYASNQT